MCAPTLIMTSHNRTLIVEAVSAPLTRRTYSRVTETGVDPIIRGMIATPVKLANRITPSVTESMFGEALS